MSEQLAGKVAYVTGAASGIGKAIADLKQDAADAAAQDIRSRGGQALGVGDFVLQGDGAVFGDVHAGVKESGKTASVGAGRRAAGLRCHKPWL